MSKREGQDGAPRRGAPDLAVVIVSYETREALARSLSAIRLSDLSDLSEVDVVVVDNASSDGSVEMLESDHPWARVIAMPHNDGFAAAANVGVAATRAEHVLILNPDVVIDPASVRRLLATMAEHPDAAGVSPMLMGLDGREQTEFYRRFPSLMQVILFWTLLAPFAWRLPALRRRWLEYRVKGKEPTPVDQLPGGAMLLRRTALDAVGPLDPGYFIWFEDVDWSYRASRQGWTLLLDPAARFSHEGGASFQGWGLDRRALQFFRAGLRFLGKHDFDAEFELAARLVPPSVRLRHRVLRLAGRPTTVDLEATRDSLERVIREMDRGRDLVITGPDPGDLEVRPPVAGSVDRTPSPARAGESDVDVVVVNWNSVDYLPRCLDALEASGLPVTLTVVDNASTDGSLAYLATRSGVRVLPLDHNAGYAEAANLGIRQGSARYAFVMNPDLLVEPSHLVVLRNRLDSDAEIGAAQGKLLRIDRATFVNGGAPPAAVLDSAGHRIRRTRSVVDRGQGQPDGPPFDREASVFSACGAGLFLRRDMLHDLAPEGPWFDPEFFAYKEDVDLGWRARLHGWDIRYVPEAVAHHVRALPGGDRGRWRSMPRAGRYHSWKNHYLMLLKNDRARDVLRSLPQVLAYEMGRLGWMVLREPSLLRAAWAAVTKTPSALGQRRNAVGSATRRGVQLGEWFGVDAFPRDPR